jgi:polar amino acid transport system substrate-binding protein
MKRLCLALFAVLFFAGSAFAEQKTFVVAHDATWPPMEFIDQETKQVIGFSVDYMNAVAKEANFNIVSRNVAWDGIFAGLENGNYNIIASSVTITEERAKQYDFSIPYYVVRQAVVMHKDATATSVDDLKGKTLGGQLGTTGFFAIRNIPEANAKSYDEIGLAMEDLFNGRIDGVVCDDPVAIQFALMQEEYKARLKVAFIIPTDTPEEYGFVVRKGDTETLELINKGIQTVKDKGIDKELQAKWFPDD